MNVTKQKICSEESENAIWIWDPDLARITWANESGLAFWGEENRLNLIDRYFDPLGHTAREFARHFEIVRNKPAVEAEISLSPKGNPLRVSCSFELCDLRDGRKGMRIEAQPLPTGQAAETVRMQEIFERAPFAAMLVGENGETLFENLAAQRIFSSETPSLAERYQSEKMAHHAVRSALINGSYSQVASLNTKIGLRKHRVNMSRIHDPVTAAAAAVVVLEDISGRTDVMTGNGLRQCKPHESSQLVAHSTGGIAVFDSSYRAIYANPAAFHLLGIDENQSFPTLSTLFEGNSYEFAKAVDSLTSGDTDRASLLVNNKDSGEAVEFVLSLAPWREDNTILDNMRLTSTQDLAPNIFELLQISHFFIDADKRICSINEKNSKLLEMSPETLIGMPLLALFEDGASERIESYLKEGVIAGGRDFASGVITRLRVGSHEHPVNLVAGRPDASGQQLILLRSAGQVSSGEKEASFGAIAHVSHELRNPLNAIMGFVEIMLSGKQHIHNARYVEYLEDILQTGQHMRRILGNLIDIHRGEIEAIRVEMEPVDVVDIVKQSIRLQEPAAQASNMTLRPLLPKSTSKLMTDPVLLRQTIDNIIANSIKYAGEGATITVRLRADKREGYVILIEDNGVGMGPEELKVAMTPYGRAPKPGDIQAGSGLGLPLAKTFAELMGATFDIRSQKGVGLAVRIIFAPDQLSAD